MMDTGSPCAPHAEADINKEESGMNASATHKKYEFKQRK